MSSATTGCSLANRARASRSAGSCLRCRHFSNDPEAIEKAFPGLKALSSAYGSVRADAGICSRLELILTPSHNCAEFEERDCTV